MSDIAITNELTKAIQDSVNGADIRSVVQAEIEKQGAVAAAETASQAEADKKAAEAAAVTETSTKFERIENIGGREFTFEASSELELERMVNNAFKVAYAVQSTETPNEPVVAAVDPAVAAAEAEARVLAKVDLENKFRLGTISAADYIEQSGAVDEYLAKKGLPIDVLKATIDQNQSTQFEQSWAQATEEFLQSAAGADWPGGDNNREMLGLKIMSLGLVDAKDKFAAIAQAYASMKATNTVFSAQAAETTGVITTLAEHDQAAADILAADKAVFDKAVADAVAASTAAVTRRTAATSSSLFGSSSGVSGSSGAAPTTAAAKPDVPADATPAEIIDAWKKSQVAAGIDPNAAFMDRFAAHRV